MKRDRPRLPKISEEMKAWSAALSAEVANWPDVTVRPMFGMFGVYRGKRILAVLPRTRALDVPDSIAFKVPVSSPGLRRRAKPDPRIKFPESTQPKWLTFAIGSEGDLRGALEWLHRAYEAAR